ncbi:hypothetical protein C8R44DRAFT_745270 [Mycena epipterygia]|nr:hypothetical protein C8R44DRAFT_745270 [Mycena epipterygia]
MLRNGTRRAARDEVSRAAQELCLAARAADEQREAKQHRMRVVAPLLPTPRNLAQEHGGEDELAHEALHRPLLDPAIRHRRPVRAKYPAQRRGPRARDPKRP